MIEYPTAEELDTRGRPDGYRQALYLIPAAEFGGPAVITHSYVGNALTPMPAYHGRWWHLCTYGEDTVGESILVALQAREELLNAISDSYEGPEWDEQSLIGCFGFDSAEFDHRWQGFDEELTQYWNAADWFDLAEVGWVELCRDAKVDPERALGADWEKVANEVAEIIEPLQDEPVAGIFEYARWRAEQYRAGDWVVRPSKQ